MGYNDIRDLNPCGDIIHPVDENGNMSDSKVIAAIDILTTPPFFLRRLRFSLRRNFILRRPSVRIL